MQIIGSGRTVQPECGQRNGRIAWGAERSETVTNDSGIRSGREVILRGGTNHSVRGGKVTAQALGPTGTKPSTARLDGKMDFTAGLEHVFPGARQ